MAACEIVSDESVSGCRCISDFTFNSISMADIAFKTVKCPVFSCRKKYLSIRVKVHQASQDRFIIRTGIKPCKASTFNFIHADDISSFKRKA